MRKYTGHITAKTGIALNVNKKFRYKNLFSLLERNRLSGEDNLGLWHDVINDSMEQPLYKHFFPSRIGALIKKLEDKKDCIKAIIYCRREVTPKVLRKF